MDAQGFHSWLALSTGWGCFFFHSFLFFILSWLQYHPLTFKCQLFLNKERTGLAAAYAGGGGHRGGRPSHHSSLRGHHTHGTSC